MKKILREKYQTTDAYGEFEAVGLVRVPCTQRKFYYKW